LGYTFPTWDIVSSSVLGKIICIHTREEEDFEIKRKTQVV